MRSIIINTFYCEISFSSTKEEIESISLQTSLFNDRVILVKLRIAGSVTASCLHSITSHSSLLSRKLNFYSDKLSGLPNTFLSSLATRRFASLSCIFRYQLRYCFIIISSLFIISSLHILQTKFCISIYFPFSLFHYTLAVAVKIKPILPLIIFIRVIYVLLYVYNSKVNK